ncbi:MAG: hypothetical protein ACK5BQ_00535 [Ignavibacteria bacterium]|jgi:hypothetical protein
MAALWILLLILVTYLLTISIVVVGQQVHLIAGIVFFAAALYGAFKLFQTRLTRL